MQHSSNKDIDKDSAIDKEFERLRQWMTYEEIENYLRKDDKPGILFSMILDRYRKNRELIALLKTEINTDIIEKLSSIDENIQVSHFFYQAALIDLHKTHNRYKSIAQRYQKRYLILNLFYNLLCIYNFQIHQ